MDPPGAPWPQLQQQGPVCRLSGGSGVNRGPCAQSQHCLHGVVMWGCSLQTCPLSLPGGWRPTHCFCNKLLFCLQPGALTDGRTLRFLILDPKLDVSTVQLVSSERRGFAGGKQEGERAELGALSITPLLQPEQNYFGVFNTVMLFTFSLEKFFCSYKV